MSRMKLLLDRPFLPSGNIVDVHPIFEFDIDTATTLGVIDYTHNASTISNPASGDTIKYDDFKIRNYSLLNALLSTNIPHQPYMDGDIFESSMSPYILEDGIYIPNPDYYTMTAIPVGERPLDWGYASNIFQYSYPSAFTYEGVEYKFQCWYNVPRTDTYSATDLYYRDVNRKMIRMFYTLKGYSFTLYRGGYKSGSTYSPYCEASGGDCRGRLTSTSSSYAGYQFTNPSNARLKYGIGNNLNGNESYITSSASKANFLLGNLPEYGTQSYIFIHYTKDNLDYYGICELTFDSYSESALPISCKVMTFTTDFWGDSIIAGGGGESNWGPIPNPDAPDGTFSTNTTNVGDRDGQHILTDTGNRVDRTFGIFSSGIYSIYEVATYGDYTNLWKIEGELFNNEFMTRYAQTYYDPLSAILAMHFLPSDFCNNGSWGNTLYDVVAAGYNISDKWYQHSGQTGTKPQCKKLQHLRAYHVGSVDLGKMYDGFPDFSPYTRAVLHLPFIGETEININSIAHGVLGITYVCDTINGNLICTIWAEDYAGNKQNIKSVNGNCAYSLPLYAKTMDGTSIGKMASGVVSALVSGAVGAATMNPISLIGVANGIVNTGMGAAEASRTSTQVRGDLGGSAMLMCPYDCWLEVTHPKWVNSMYYSQLIGHASFMSNRIADNGQQYEAGMPIDSGEAYSGYLEVQSIELDNVNCTESERSEIEKLLMGGVFVRGDELQ